MVHFHSFRRGLTPSTVALLLLFGVVSRMSAAVIWVEGEKPAKAAMNRHPWWYDQVKKEFFSGGDFVSNFNDKKEGTAEYAVEAPAAGEYEFWVHANPVKAKLSYKLADGAWIAIDLDKNEQSHNVAADNKPDLRFIAWIKVGAVKLKKGQNTIAFKMHSEAQNHGYLDCFVLSSEPFKPQELLKPGQIAVEMKRLAEEEKDWFAFTPADDKFGSQSGFDLRDLNEKAAGDGGLIVARNGQFVHAKTGKPVRFWAVNGPPHDIKDPAELVRCGRLLAKYGINMTRIHGGCYDEAGTLKPDIVQHKIEIVQAMKQSGIYSHLSIYFPLWLKPKAGTPWLKGYDGTKHPFAALYFNKDFQQQYQSWWKAMLLTPDAKTGKRLVDDPALAAVEIINEDSYFFWTFDAKNIPDEQLQIVESQFGAWLKKKYGSLDAAQKAWKGKSTPRDSVAEGRMGFRNWWAAFTEKSQRDQDAAAFLLESQRGFYEENVKFLRGLGFKGLITCSNWTTANNQVLGPLEKYSYLAGDFVDRHGYFSCHHKGDNAGWSVRNGHTYADRSALKFEPEEPGKPKSFVHPAMDAEYNGLPSMISETTFNRPNRYRGEAPLFYAAYGALQDSDCLVHFALDGERWSVKPRFFMQPWTLMAPTQMGQFPAAALIYRQGLVKAGDIVVDLKLKLTDLIALKGSPLVQEASFDELRLKDVPDGVTLKPGNVVDPLVHLVGRVKVAIGDEAAPAKLADLKLLIDRKKQTVASTTGELKLDFGKGLLTINAPAAQGVSGALSSAGEVTLGNLAITSDMELGHIVAVSLDGRPLSSSQRILLQVMSEEKANGFRTEPLAGGIKRIVDIGREPWMVKKFAGTVRLKRADAAQLTVTPLDFAGYPGKPLGAASEVKLEPTTMYYLISR